MTALFSTPHLAAAYVLVSLVVAFIGRHRRAGFWGFLVLSLVLTPIVTALLMYASLARPQQTVAPSARPRPKA